MVNEQLEKDAIIKDLSNQLREKDAIMEDLSNQHGKKGKDTTGDEAEDMAEKDAEIKELHDLLNKRGFQLREQHKLYHELLGHNELLKAQARVLEAQAKTKDKELNRFDLSQKVGYEFGSTGKVVLRGNQVSVVLCLLLHSDKSSRSIFKPPHTVLEMARSETAEPKMAELTRRAATAESKEAYLMHPVETAEAKLAKMAEIITL